ESVLDTLAKDFKIDWYDYDYTVDAKRALIKSSFAVHRKLGTKQAMVEALQCVYSNARVEEWFDYGGEPYYFRVVLDAAYADLSTATDTGIINSIIATYKSLHSHMEDTYYRAVAALALVCSFGYVLYATRLCGTHPSTATQGEIDSSGIVASAAGESAAYEVIPCGTSLCGTL
ncbi:MAG: phage tail protein I, partial [Oscillospiraceae bacterium]|nr:phage tail protein I [Oscillospiraceae bacterium]